MHRIDNSSAATSLPAAAAPGPNPNGYYQSGNPGAGTPATVLDQDAFNAVQEEICHVVTTAGLTLTKGNYTQLYSAIQTLISSAAAGAVPSGSLVYFGAASAPTGFLECNGAAISRTTYAVLFAAIGVTFGAGNGTTTFNLPDLRGQFVRGYDDGAGVDAGRTFGSSQTDAMQGHFHNPPAGAAAFYGSTSGPNNPGTGGSPLGNISTTGAPVTDGSNGTPRTAAETRPKNIALLPCIKY